MLGLSGWDFLFDLRNLVYDLTHKENNLEYYIQTSLDIIALIPYLEVIKNVIKPSDVTKVIIKNMEATDAVKGVGKANPNGIKINVGKQDKHIPGTNNYKQSIASGANRSILAENPQQLLDDFAGTGQKIGANKERVDFGKVIGQYYDESTGTFVDTTRGIIHYDSKGGSHIVPSAPR